ncbi:alpha/beta fold hydrolase [Streptomyces sp. NPDC048392]|uniref:alpha/beta fold hydrolase n=1 Tax=Streptomyces sp. NPDC048392 TaxID=3365543 RepID=UPI00371006B3
MTTTLTLHDIPVAFTDRGTGHAVLLLHGGGGPGTVEPWADRLAASREARVITPTHPGFNGTVRPAPLTTVAGLAALYTDLLERLELRDVTVVGNSVGGWIAAEMAVRAPERAGRYVVVDGVGVRVPGHPVADFSSLTLNEVAALSYADPAAHFTRPDDLPPAARRAMPGNRGALELYAGRAMSDATLLDRLRKITDPALVVWGEADRICTPGYGHAFAAAIPGATYTVVKGAGHLPQIEQPGRLADLVWNFITSRAHA